MAASYLDAAWSGQQLPDLDVPRRHAERWDVIRAAARAGMNSPLTSSAGRLFDAIAAILDVRDEVSYEGQAAVELEQLASPGETDGYAVGAHDESDMVTIRSADLVRAVVTDRLAGVAPATIAARFHNAVATMIVTTCRSIRDEHGLGVVALSGGVFQNRRLVESCLTELGAAGFAVLTHRQVPPNDGGISLGQAVVAAARSG
jgi:hydrogenase maturation protein HypF